jgi:hypothetical protein
LAIVALAVGAAVVVRTASEERPLLRLAQIGPPLLRLIRVGSFDEPVYVTASPGDRRRLFVVERTGRIHVVRDWRLVETRCPSQASAGTVPRRSPTRMPSVRREPAVRVSPPASNPRSLAPRCDPSAEARP